MGHDRCPLCENRAILSSIKSANGRATSNRHLPRKKSRLSASSDRNLFDCILDEDLDTLRIYVERGGPVHVADALGDTSLLVAASTGNVELMKVCRSQTVSAFAEIRWCIFASHRKERADVSCVHQKLRAQDPTVSLACHICKKAHRAP